ncbi:hypothetical protein Tco_1325261, partial [Tanacetum coccineum]
MVNGGSPPLTVVDRWSGGGPGDGRQATWHHSGGDTWPSNDWNVRWQVRGTVHTRFRIHRVQYKVQSRRVST